MTEVKATLNEVQQTQTLRLIFRDAMVDSDAKNCGFNYATLDIEVPVDDIRILGTTVPEVIGGEWLTVVPAETNSPLERVETPSGYVSACQKCERVFVGEDYWTDQNTGSVFCIDCASKVEGDWQKKDSNADKNQEPILCRICKATLEPDAFFDRKSLSYYCEKHIPSHAERS